MPLLWIILLTSTLTIAYINDIDHRSTTISDDSSNSAIVLNLLIYRNALKNYSLSNPSFQGNPIDTALQLPAWYTHIPGIVGYINATGTYVYITTPPPGLIAELYKVTGSISVGYANNGFLFNSTAGSTAIPIPALIPNGAAVTFL